MKTTAQRIRLLGFAAALTASTALAGPIVNRETNQQDRIEQGVSNGSLTPAEASSLERQQTSIERQRERAIANDGRVGPREAAHLTHAQDRASARIYRLRHNARTAN